jgi:ABC-type Fe3+-hydroxamate transport system substrate-binding protein
MRGRAPPAVCAMVRDVTSPPAPVFAPGASCVDAAGAVVALPRQATRIVSLVPSATETLFALGLGERVVGVTEWCIHPRDLPPRMARVRGTKNPDLDAIVRLGPDLVLANHEENREVDVRRLRERGVTVWVDYPRSVADAVEHVRALARLGASDAALAAIVEPIDAALARLARDVPVASERTQPRAFIAVWKDPWMTLSRDTYAHDLLAHAGIANLFADADGRYPKVTLDEVAARDPEIVLLPDEPYRFTDADAAALIDGPLAHTTAARAGNVHVIDGTLPFWHGPRIAQALTLLGGLAARAATTRRR